MVRLIRLGFALWIAGAALCAQSASRPMAVEDLFTLAELDDVTLSPDGEWIAATITRPGRPNGCPTCPYKETGDVWLVNRRSGERRNLTNGASDASSSWLPSWSPDGRRLAFVSTRRESSDPPGENIRVYHWELGASDLPLRASSDGVFLQVDFQMPAGPGGPIAWLDATTLLFAFLPPGASAQESILYWKRGIGDARRAWEKGAAGSENTASVIESGGAAREVPSIFLTRFDAVRRAGSTLAEIPRWDLWDLTLATQIAISPDRKRAAFLAVTGTIGLRPEAPVTEAIRTYRAGIVPLESLDPIVWAALDATREHVEGDLGGWSPDGREIAITEHAEPGTKSRRRIVLRVSAQEGASRDVTPAGMTVGATKWSADGALLARMRPVDTGAVAASRPGSWLWWKLEEGKPPVDATAATTSRPSGESASRPVTPPSSTATRLGGDPRLDVLLFRDQTPLGTFVWTTDGAGGHARKLLAVNEHVAQIAESSRIMIPYRGADGDELQGLAILPPGYQPGKRHPVVTWVYGGLVVRGPDTPLAGKQSTRPLNLEILAGHGYVVLIPSIPLPPFGGKSDPWLEIPKGVLPCVDKLVEMGIADPDRLAVMGHSTGGYTTYAVVTYTTRFKAAIALSGHPDLISLHGQFYPGERMSDRAQEGLATVRFTEYGPLGLGGPPSEDLWRYLRNTPLFYFDRVTTPLMIVHGDMDGAPIQQGEEAFTALSRLGRRAKFVRYWGEGHVVSSPANVRHLWGQIFDWLDSHLGVSAAGNGR